MPGCLMALWLKSSLDQFLWIMIKIRLDLVFFIKTHTICHQSDILDKHFFLISKVSSSPYLGPA